VTRSSNNYGPYQFPEKVIPLFVTNILRGKKVPLYGTGLNVRDWLHVEDNCAAIRRVLDMGVPGEIYNIAGNHELTNLNLTDTILGLMDISDVDAHIQPVDDRKGHDWRYSMDCTKIRSKLLWEPSTPFGGGLMRTIQWYKENEAWWKPLIKH